MSIVFVEKLLEEQECVTMVNAKEFWMKEGEKKGEKIGEKKGVKIGEKIGEMKNEKKWLKKVEKIEFQKGIEAVVVVLQELNFSIEEIIEHLQKRYQLSRREAMIQAKKAMT